MSREVDQPDGKTGDSKEEVLDRVSDGVYALDEEFRFTYLNDRAEELLQASADELLGERLWDVYPEAAAVDEVWNAFHRALETQEQAGYELYYEPLGFWVEATVYPSETGVSVYFRDVSERKEVRQRLEEERDMFAAGPTVVFRWNPGTGWPIEYVSGNVEDVLGYTPEELESGSVQYTDLLHEADVDRVATELAAHSDGSTDRFDHEPYRIETKHGDVRWVKDTTKVVRDENGEVDTYLGYLVDITERKQRERELAESRRRYRALVENFPNGAVALVDQDLTYRTAGGTPVDRGLDSADALEGKSVEEAVSPELVENVKPRYEAALDGERSELEVEHAGQHSRMYIFPVTDDDGAVFAAMGMSQDITEQKEHERELEQYRALTQAANDAIVTIDESSTIRSANPRIRDVFGYEPDELVGERLTVLMPDDLVEDHVEALERYLETGERELDWNYVELAGKHRDGSKVPLALSFNDIDHADETYFVGIIRDISERKEYERKLEASNERLERFAHAASHDLQEPLRMVSSYLQLLENRYSDELDEDAREFIEFAMNGADRMREMIDGLLAYSRVETGGEPFETVDLDAVLEDVLEDLQLQIQDSNATITAEPLPAVEGDASQLRQVLQNLVENAIEYSGDAPPRVHVSAERNGDEWAVTVRDEGQGIPPDKQDRVFEVFERLHTADENGGTGIGLALCERIVERHEGELRVESDPGDWTAFEFTLPAAGS